VHALREILHAFFFYFFFYVLKSGCAWRLLPHDLRTPRKTVHRYFGRWRIDGTWERVHAALRERVRVRQKRDPRDLQPSAAIVGSRSVKTTG
jgi:putative transposase